MKMVSLKNLKVWQKLALLGLVLIIPFAVVAYQLVASINTLGVQFAQKEIRGIEYYSPLLSLLKQCQLHRDLASGLLNGNASQKDRLAAVEAEIEKALVTADETDQRLNAVLGTTKKWAALRTDCRLLVSETRSLSSTESFQRHTKLIGELTALIAPIGLPS